MKADLRSLYEEIKKSSLLISIIDVSRYPMTPMEYRRALNIPTSAYVNIALKKLHKLGIFKTPTKARYGKLYVLAETGEEARKERCKELGKEYDYLKPDFKWHIYSRIVIADRRKKVIKAMTGKPETFTQIYKKTSLRFDNVNVSLREFLRLGIAVQKKARGRYKLNKEGMKIKDFINRIDEIRKKQGETEEKQENNSI